MTLAVYSFKFRNSIQKRTRRIAACCGSSFSLGCAVCAITVYGTGGEWARVRLNAKALVMLCTGRM